MSLVLVLSVSATAQQSTGTITGRATDADGGALPGVAVSIASPQMIGGTRDAITDDQGAYRFTLLASGTYSVNFMLAGFRTLKVESITVNAGQTITINGKLDLATLDETVTVTSCRPPSISNRPSCR
jgi:Carboxypeptidase regulatory-like domain